MFGSIGGPELLLILVVALLVFGPKRIPELSRTIGRGVAEFRRATNDFKSTLEREVSATQQEVQETPQAPKPTPESPAQEPADTSADPALKPPFPEE